MTGPWVGVDPGGSHTGVALRLGNRLLWHNVVERTADEDALRGVGVGPEYIAKVRIAIEHALDHGHRITDVWPRIAVEGVVAPSPWIGGKQRITDPTPALAAAVVLGAVLVGAPGTVIVPPNHHGEGLLAGYPPSLVTAAEMRHGLHRAARHGSSISHARAAFDVAGEGPRHAAIRSARRGGATA